MRVLTVNGEQLTDMIVWLWEADDDTVELEVFDPRDGTVTPVELDRFPGEDWGLEFDGPIFDGMRTLRQRLRVLLYDDAAQGRPLHALHSR